MKSVKEQVGPVMVSLNQVWRQVDRQVWVQVRNQVWEQVDRQICDQVWFQVKHEIG